MANNQNGKGSKKRPCNNPKQARKNYENIKWSKDKKQKRSSK